MISGFYIPFIFVIFSVVNGGPTLTKIFEDVDADDLETTCEILENDNDPGQLMYKLQDVLPQIFRDMSIEDLGSLQSTCKMFQDPVNRVLAKRGPNLRIIDTQKYITFNHENFFTIPELKTKHLKHYVDIAPKIALFFTDNSEPLSNPYDRPRELMADYIPQLPRDCSIVHSKSMSVMLNKIHVEAKENTMVGLFLPKRNAVNIGIAVDQESHPSEQEFISERLDSLMGKIFLKPNSPCQSNNFGIIILGTQSPNSETNDVTANLLREIEKKFAGCRNELALWGGVIESINSFGVGFSEGIIEDNLFLLSLSGDKVRTWSVMIDRRTSDQEKTQAFDALNHQKIASKTSNSFALAMHTLLRGEDYGHTTGNNKVFAGMFPDIRLMTIGIRPAKPKYCVNSTTATDHKRIEIHEEHYFICYLVITYL